MTVLFNIFIRQTLTDAFWGLHKNMNCAFPLNKVFLTVLDIISTERDSTFFFLIFNWDSPHARLNSHYEAWSYKKKRLQDTENLFRKNLQLKDAC